MFWKNWQRKDWIIAMLVGLNVITLATVWLLPHKPPHRRIDQFLKKELSLNEEQVAQIKSFRQAHRKLVDQHKERIDQKHQEIIAALNGATRDTAQAYALGRSLATDKAKMEALWIDHYLQIEQVCNEAQRVKLAAIFLELMHPPKPPRPH